MENTEELLNYADVLRNVQANKISEIALITEFPFASFLPDLIIVIIFICGVYTITKFTIKKACKLIKTIIARFSKTAAAPNKEI